MSSKKNKSRSKPGHSKKKERKISDNKAKSPKKKRYLLFIISLIATIFVGFLALMGDLFTGIGTKYFEKPKIIHVTPLKKVSITEPVFLRNQSDCKVPPILCPISSDTALESDDISIRFGKSRLYKEISLPSVDRKCFSFHSNKSGKRFDVLFDTNAAINSHYPDTPYGEYCVQFMYITEEGVENVRNEIKFNHVYREDFKNLDEVLIPNNNTGFVNIQGTHGGLEIKNQSIDEGFISADLKQKFDFETNFYIKGFVTMEFENVSKPCGLDFVFCDNYGWERLSVILADGQLNGFSIKMPNEKIGNKNVKIISEQVSLGRTTENEIVPNYFMILFSKVEGENWCHIFISSDLQSVSQVHARVVDCFKFRGKFAQLKLRLWKAGTIKLFGLEVGESSECQLVNDDLLFNKKKLCASIYSNK